METVNLESSKEIIKVLKALEERKLGLNKTIFEKQVSVLKGEKFIEESKKKIEVGFINSENYSFYKNDTTRKIKLAELYSENLEIEHASFEVEKLKFEVEKLKFEIDEVNIEINFNKRLLDLNMKY